MTVIVPDFDFIKKHYDKTIELLEIHKLDSLKKLIESFSDEYAIAPASGQKEYHSSFPGGLCYHNLHVLQWLGRFASAMGNFDKETLLKVALLHDIGKLGEAGKPYYIKCEDAWKINKGYYYDINPQLQYMKMSQRSLCLAQAASISLTQDEYLAILLADGQLDETNAHYKYKEPKLATVLHYSVYWARSIEKENDVRWPG
jgi:hypothetical protein